MSKTVFILGAGASAEAGGPLMDNFVAKAETIFRDGKASKTKDSFDLVFKARGQLQRAYVKSKLDLDHLEELFAAFEMAGLIGRLADLQESEVSQLSLAMRRVITTTLERNIQFYRNPEGKLLPPHSYRAFAEFINYLQTTEHSSISIISFNYDLCLDYALMAANIPIDYRLHAAGSSASLDLLKLHGSLNWFKTQDEIVVAKLDSPSVEGQPRTLMSVATTSLFASGQSLPNTDDPLIVPPTWNKGQHHQEFSILWKRAAAHLAEAENIIVVGYSAPTTDQFYRHLYALSTISDVMLSRYVCIGPKVGQNHNQLIGAAGRDRHIFKEIPHPFTQCYSQLLTELNLEHPQAPGMIVTGTRGHQFMQIARGQDIIGK